jgi:hypothetical protein
LAIGGRQVVGVQVGVGGPSNAESFPIAKLLERNNNVKTTATLVIILNILENPPGETSPI